MPEIRPDSAATCALLEQVRQGDTQALEQLLERHRPDLRDFVDFHLDPRLRAESILLTWYKKRKWNWSAAWTTSSPTSQCPSVCGCGRKRTNDCSTCAATTSPGRGGR